MTELEFQRVSETGDIMLFETDNIGANLQRKITFSKYGKKFNKNELKN